MERNRHQGELNAYAAINAAEQIVDPFASVRGQVDPRRFLVPFPVARAIELSLRQYLRDEQLLEGATSSSRDFLEIGKPVLKALREGKPTSMDERTGEYREIQLVITGQQIVDLDSVVQEVTISHKQKMSPWVDKFIQNLAEGYPMAESAKKQKAPFSFMKSGLFFGKSRL